MTTVQTFRSGTSALRKGEREKEETHIANRVTVKDTEGQKYIQTDRQTDLSIDLGRKRERLVRSVFPA